MTTTNNSPFVYLSGACRREILDGKSADLGVIHSPDIGNRVHDHVDGELMIGLDNGCFANPKKYSDERFVKYLTKMGADGRAPHYLFANAADVLYWHCDKCDARQDTPGSKGRCIDSDCDSKKRHCIGDAARTAVESIPMLRKIRELGFKAGFVAQDGIGATTVPWAEFDVLFIGGSDDFKYSDELVAVIDEAKARGKWVHMGRVNSWKRISHSAAIGCDSADGTYVAYGPDKNLPKVREWLSRLNGDTATASAAA